MNIRIEITDTNKPYAVIYTNKITPEVQQAVSLLDTKSELITANDDEKNRHYSTHRNLYDSY